MTMREKIARAWFKAEGRIICQDGDAWDLALDDWERNIYLLRADAVLDAIEQAGMVVVPREPTVAMIEAGGEIEMAGGYDYAPLGHCATQAWQAMIDAAKAEREG